MHTSAHSMMAYHPRPVRLSGSSVSARRDKLLVVHETCKADLGRSQKKQDYVHLEEQETAYPDLTDKRHASKHEYDSVIHDTNLLNMRILSRGAMLAVHHGFLPLGA